MYKLTVTYGDENEDFRYPSEFPELDAGQVETAVGAFMRDMLGLPGSRVRKVTIERER